MWVHDKFLVFEHKYGKNYPIILSSAYIWRSNYTIFDVYMKIQL
jgi:hypothetical protein